MANQHYSKLPPIPGYIRVSDGAREFTHLVGFDDSGPVKETVAVVVRRARCNRCGHIIPTLGRAYHEQGRPCVERYPHGWEEEA